MARRPQNGARSVRLIRVAVARRFGRPAAHHPILVASIGLTVSVAILALAAVVATRRNRAARAVAFDSAARAASAVTEDPPARSAANPVEADAVGSRAERPSITASRTQSPPRPDPPMRSATRTVARRAPSVVRRRRILTPARSIAALAAILVAGGVVTGVVVVTRAGEASATGGGPVQASSAPSRAGVVAVIGDELTATSASVPASQRWTTIVADRLHAAVPPIAKPGVGYVAGGTDGGFAGLAARVPHDARVVVFFGGRNDVGADPIAIARGATRAFAAARTAAPSATIIVVGPTSTRGTPSTRLLSVRDALSSSAAIVRARFVDPLKAGWLTRPDSSSSSSAQLARSEQKILAARMSVLLKPMLAGD